MNYWQRPATLQRGAGDGQTPCGDPTTGKSLQELVTAEGSGLATPYGQMVINPCVPMTSAPNPACPASALCCINLNSSSWTSCGSAPTWLRFGEFEARAQTGPRITAGGGAQRYKHCTEPKGRLGEGRVGNG